MKSNGTKQFLWKVVAMLMTLLFAAGSYIHKVSVDDMAALEKRQETQAEEIQALEQGDALNKLSLEHITDKQNKMDKTLTEVRDIVLQIQAKIE